MNLEIGRLDYTDACFAELQSLEHWLSRKRIFRCPKLFSTNLIRHIPKNLI